MFKNQSVIYSPYGAYELKATYQQNILYSNLLVLGFAALITLSFILVGSFAKESEVVSEPLNIIEIDMEPVPAIVPDQPIVDIRPSKQKRNAFEQLAPLDDDNLLKDEIEMIEIEDSPVATGTEVGQSIEKSAGEPAFTDDKLMPGVNVFVPGLQIPQFIFKAMPKYPRMAKLAGIEGTVWIAAEIDINGAVIDARIYKTSSHDVLDQAALGVAFENKFRPAIQNGFPVELWIAYQVDFVLNR